jgi:hypothetical protein
MSATNYRNYSGLETWQIRNYRNRLWSEKRDRELHDSLYRRVREEMFYWVGLRYGLASIMERDSTERDRLEACETLGDLIRFWMETATPNKAWKNWSMRERWNWFRRASSSYYHGGQFKNEYDRERLFEQMRQLLNP